MGVTVAAFGVWVRDLWELYGDGRTFVSRLEREALLRAVCEGPAEGGCVELESGKRAQLDGASGRCELAEDCIAEGACALVEDGEAEALGLDRVAAACVAAGVGLPAFDAAVRDARQGVPAGAGALEGVTRAEVPVLRMIGGYLDRLAQLELIEPGQALALLPELLPQRPLRVLLEDAAPLTPGQEAFFSACPWMGVEVRAASGSQGPVRAPEGVRVRFAYPSGQYAWPALLADIVRDALGAAAGRGAAPAAVAVPAAAAGPAAGDDGASSCEDASGSADGYRDGRSAGAQAAAVVVARGFRRCCSDAWRRRLFVRAMWLPYAGRRRFADTAFGRAICSFAVSLTKDRRAAFRISKGTGISPRPMWSAGTAPTWPIGRLSPFSGH